MPPKYKLVTIVVGPIETNCYLLADAETLQALVIDPGADPERIIKRIEYNKFIPAAIVNTHGHYDHITGNKAVKDVYKVPLMIHKADAPMLADPELSYSNAMGSEHFPLKADRELTGGDVIEFGSLKAKVFDSPGHSPGGLLLLCEDLLFTGDTLFAGDVGRTDLTGGSDAELTHSLKVFRTLPEGLRVLPGHGPASTLKDELANNPYL